MTATTLAGKLLNQGLAGPKTALGDKLDAVNDYLTALAAGLNTYLTALSGALNTQVLQSGALAEGTTAAKIKTTAITYYTIAGKFYAKAITDDLSLTAATAQVALSKCCYLIEINAAGTVSSVKGTHVLTASGVEPTIPAPSDLSTKCPIGVLKVTTTNAATFTANTTDLSASDVAGVFANYVGAVPSAITLTTAQGVLAASLAAAQPAAV